MSLNDEVVQLFQSLSAMMELKGESVFKVIAFQKVSRIIRDSNLDLRRCVQENTLCEIEGIGKSSQQIIEEYINSGRSTVYDEIAASVPGGLVSLMSIEGLGPKTINLLWKQRNITSLEELEKAIESASIMTLKGMGEKKIETIRRGIADYKSRQADGAVARRTGIAVALEAAEPMLQQIRNIKGVV